MLSHKPGVIALLAAASIAALASSAPLTQVRVAEEALVQPLASAHGIVIDVGGQKLELAVEGTSAFRVSIGSTTEKIESPIIVQKSTYDNFTEIHEGDVVGISTPFGSVRFNHKTYAFEMRNSKDVTIVNSDKLSSVFSDSPSKKGSIDFEFNDAGTFFGTGGGPGDGLVKTGSNPEVQNTVFYTSHLWSTQGYGALGVTYQPHGDSLNTYAASWSSSKGSVTWSISGTHADLYLMPSETPYDGLNTLWDLTGRPALLPRYAFGFLASRWGWVNNTYIDEMLTDFRKGNYPIDAFISDFEWYTPEPDYDLNSTGLPTFHDFGYNNVTFPDPVNQLKHYRDDLHFRFGGIRKPRLGNTDLLNMARSKGWLLDDGSDSTQGRNLNYSIEAVRSWYNGQQEHYLKDGVDFWWNDEGETDYFTFFWWNQAHFDGLKSFDARRRFFTINRSYSPGMQRFGLTIWTGDIKVNWQTLAQQPATMLNWIMAGAGYTTCDIGGFSGPDDPPLLLARWYQLGVFLPVMRVHSTISDKPHFPFLYGTEADNAMRKALELRYRLLPMHYSLAYDMYYDGRPIFRPLFFDFPNDEKITDITDQWLDGDYLMVAPVVNQDNSSDVYLPDATWYVFNSTKTYNGGVHVKQSNVALDDIPMFVRQGGIVPLGPVVQYSDLLPGGPLEIQVYDGAYGSFTLIEDDGATKDYVENKVKKTIFLYNTQKKELTWTTDGSFTGPNVFKKVFATLFTPGGKKTSKTVDLSATGSIQF